MTDDDDAPLSAEETADAARLAGLVDDLLAGAPAPPVLPAGQRTLLDAAAAIRAARPLSAKGRERVLRGVTFGRPRGQGAPLAMMVMLAAAAILLLSVRPEPPPRTRAASALVGRIEAADAAGARARLDVVYADRLSGYRQRLLDGRPW